MRITIFYIILIINVICTQAQLNVHSGVLNINEGSVTFNETSVNNDGSFISSQNTNVYLNSNDIIYITGDSVLQFGNLNSETLLTIQEVDIDLKGDLTLKSEYEITNNNIFLGGELIGENELYYVFAAGSGEIIKEVNLNPGQWHEPGNLGLQFILSNPVSFNIHRGHFLQDNSFDKSIYRYYRFTGATPVFQELYFYYLEHELNEIEEEGIAIWTLNEGTWKERTSSSFEPAYNYLSLKNDEPLETITLFPERFAGNVYIPDGFSPNGDNVNEFFVINGIENFPDNKLVVINQWGEIVYQAQPYDNSWQGENTRDDVIAKSAKLKSGTYFYIFYKNEKDIKPKKGYIEIRTGDR